MAASTDLDAQLSAMTGAASAAYGFMRMPVTSIATTITTVITTTLLTGGAGWRGLR